MKTRLQDHLFILVLVVVASVFVGFTIMVQQTTSPVMKRLVSQQTSILELQKKLDRQMEEGSMAVAQPIPFQPPAPMDIQQMANVLAKQQIMENRIAALEGQINGLTKLLKEARPPAPPARPAPPTDEYTKVHKIDSAHSPIKGKKDAPITIVEFVDFQCPFCLRFHPVVDEVLAAYPGKVNYILKNFPLGFHQQAKPAAKAAFAAGEQGKYWEMVDVLLANGRELSDEKFEQLAKEIGLNVKKFKAAYKNKDAEWDKWIQADMTLAQQVGVRGTPTFYLNGKKTQARDLASFKKQIDVLLKQK